MVYARGLAGEDDLETCASCHDRNH